MIHFYTNRELSEKLDINLARWKRWSRSFLPPDPLGGLQSGYTRQYLFKDLFKVFLGGHLLGHLKLSLPESRRVLADLSPWLIKDGFFELTGFQERETSAIGHREGYRIYFCSTVKRGKKNRFQFAYLIRQTRHIQRGQSPDGELVTETYAETRLHCDRPKGEDLLQSPSVQLINLSGLYEQVHAALNHQPR